MNKSPSSLGATLERRLADRLKGLLAAVPGLGEWQVAANPADYDRAFDLEASSKLRHGPRIELWVECKAEPRPVHFPSVSIENQFREQKPSLIRVPVLAAPVIGPRMAEVCWEHGWSWFDLAGNCRLSVPGHLYIERQGLKPAKRAPKAGANLGTPEAARVLRAILLPENNASFWTQRNLQERCRPGVSLGLVNKVLRHLQSEKYVEEDDEGRYQVRDAAGLLAAWRMAYQFKRVKQHRLFTLKRPPELERALKGIGPHGEVKVAHAAFSAAELQAPAVRQSKSWLMVSSDWADEVSAALEAKEVDTGDNLVLLVPSDDGPFYEAELRPKGLPCTHPLQTYLDVSRLPGRGEEAAEALLSQVIKPAWKTRGLV